MKNKNTKPATATRKPRTHKAVRVGRLTSSRQLPSKKTLLILIFLLAGFGTYGYWQHTESSAASCTISATLVNSCHPWLGAAVNQYPGHTASIADRFSDEENRIGRQLDVVHVYDNQGQTLSGDAKTYATRANTYLMLNWKPADPWATGDGSNATVNAQIDAMASSIKAIAPHKLFLTVYHEPEDNISPGGSPSCGSSFGKGTSGTTADYVAMWHNVRARFDALGVTNVAWGFNTMSFPGNNCAIPDLWPGNAYVDWFLYDTYLHDNTNKTFSAAIGTFYNYLTANSNSTHDYLSKTWGINEWGTEQTNQTAAYQAYADAKTALDNNAYPKIKLYNIFDEVDAVSTGADIRTQYNAQGVLDQTEQDKYNLFANDSHFTDAYYQGGTPAPGDTTAPSVSITSPVNGTTVSGTITIAATASDNVGVSNVSMTVDGKSLGSDSSSPYSFTLNTSTYSNGSHSLLAAATDAAGNHSSNSVTVTIANTSPPASDPTTPSTGNSGSSGTTVLDTNTSPSGSPVSVSGNVIIQPTTPGSNVALKVDGKQTTGNSIDTTQLTNGVHTVSVTENGQTKQIEIAVHNPWYLNFKNHLQTQPVKYSVSSLGALTVLGGILWVLRPRIASLVWHFKTRNYIHF